MFFVFLLGFIGGCWFTNSHSEFVSEQIEKTKKFLGDDNGSKKK